MFQTLKFLPAKILFIDGELLGIMAFGLAGLLWMLVPFWDRSSARGEKNRKVTYAGIFAVMFIIIMTIVGWLS
jgi:quinol-cytochrome oxidoreductase complex cytochrome b subunit